MFRTVGPLRQNQEQDAGFPNRLSDLSGVRATDLYVAGRYPAVNLFGFQGRDHRFGYGLVFGGIRDENCVRLFLRFRLSCAWTVTLGHFGCRTGLSVLWRLV